MTDAPLYEIRTVRDMAQIPRDRWAAFVEDLTIVVNAMRATNVAFDLGPEEMLDGALLWRDDGEAHAELQIQDEDGGHVCTVQAGRDA